MTSTMGKRVPILPKKFDNFFKKVAYKLIIKSVIFCYNNKFANINPIRTMTSTMSKRVPILPKKIDNFFNFGRSVYPI